MAKRMTFLAVGSALGGLVASVLVAAPAAAGTVGGVTTLGTVTVTVPDQAWTGYGRQPLRVQARASGITLERSEWAAGVTAMRPNRTAIGSTMVWGRGNGPLTERFVVAPLRAGSGNGQLVADVYVIVLDPTAVDPETGMPSVMDEAWLETNFAMTKMATTTRIADVQRRGGKTRVVGRATALSSTKGRIGARGGVIIERRKSGEWVRVAAVQPANTGRFVATVRRGLPRRATVRVVYRGDRVTLPSVSQPAR